MNNLDADKKNWYDKSYKLLLVLPLILLAFSIAYLFVFNQKNGDIILKDVSITGGTTITVFIETDIVALRSAIVQEFPDVSIREVSDIRTGKKQGFFLETSVEPEKIKPAIEKYLNAELTGENSSIEFTGSALSSSFYNQLRMAVIISFILMAVVVFIIFRTPIPSMAVIIAAFADIVMTLAVINLFGMSVSIAGIVAILMLIGYSVDTDILLTSRVIKNREGTINQRILGALKTGLTMTLTSIVAVSVSLIFIYSFSETLRQMFTILLIGLGSDMFNTWLTNASMLKWYAERKEGLVK